MIVKMIETGLRDKVVIVTGAAAGIGQATAIRNFVEVYTT